MSVGFKIDRLVNGMAQPTELRGRRAPPRRVGASQQGEPIRRGVAEVENVDLPCRELVDVGTIG